MSWSIEEHIGENRPWPTQIIVYKGETSESMAYVSGEVADRLKAENAKLKRAAELDADVLESLNLSLEESQAENAKLRELADAVKEFVEDTHCWECPFRRDCNDNNRIFCADNFSYHAFAAMRKLGIEA